MTTRGPSVKIFDGKYCKNSSTILFKFESRLGHSSYCHAHNMAAEATTEGSSWQEKDSPPFKRAVADLRFVNISIKCYEKKTGTGFKDEYYAYKILAM